MNKAYPTNSISMRRVSSVVIFELYTFQSKIGKKGKKKIRKKKDEIDIEPKPLPLTRFEVIQHRRQL